ncbi:DoxX-like family protein [Paenibacillus abyssi]|uniref:Membrane protein n=1 Tax=Paenibacillus abyssi TaxID=1340531 RepID=A0A917CU13_9BACL|nr:DoxX-like family protein [Paenibacillus abyssi]GGF98203.1 membrane protein [Paenibacillus abyssi]
MNRKPIYVEIDIDTDMDSLWRHTQTPELHEQWDLRFSEISYLPRDDEKDPQYFLYRTRICFGLDITGTGETKANIHSAGGERTSTLTFGSDQQISLIRKGGGYWKYKPKGKGVTFMTQYDYQTRLGIIGRWFDQMLFRPLFGYATAWSFDMLRIWLEKFIPPAVTMQRAVMHYFSVLMLVFLWCYQGIVPKLLFPEAGELALLQALGWFGGREEQLLLLLGVAEISLGLLIFKLHRHRWVYFTQIVLLALLAAAALIGTPEMLAAPFNPLTLSCSMIGFCLLAHWSARDLPQANRCLRKPAYRSKGDERGWHRSMSKR